MLCTYPVLQYGSTNLRKAVYVQESVEATLL